MDVKKQLARGAATVAAMAAVSAMGLAAAPHAEAATGYARCPSGHLCVFNGLNGSGRMAYYKNGDANLADGVGATGMNNNIESLWNRTGNEWKLFGRTYYNGKVIWSNRKGNMPTGYRNWASSIKRTSISM